MPDIWWQADPHDLHRIVDRVSSAYVERGHLGRDETPLSMRPHSRCGLCGG